MAFDLGVETWRDRKYGLYKFIFIPLLDKKSNKLEKKKKDEPKNENKTDDTQPKNN